MSVQGTISTEKMHKLESILQNWAEIALRTLVFAYREMTDFDEWYQEYEEARSDPRGGQSHHMLTN